MSGLKLTPSFDINELFQGIDDDIEDEIQKTILAFSYIGEEIINKARDGHTFGNRTRQLEGSTGYFVTVNGEEAMHGQIGDGEAEEDARKLYKEVASMNGVSLCIVAGKDYAAAVEAMGYDVITNSIPKESEILKRLEELLDD